MLDSVSKIISLIPDFEQYYLYCVDPGAYYCMQFIYHALNEQNQTFWIVEGWCKYQIADNENILSWSEFEQKFSRKQSNKICLLLGSQTNFRMTQHSISFCNTYHIRSFFLFDHWTNYLNHFYDVETKRFFLPSKIGVMDEIAYNSLIRELSTIIPCEKYERNIHIVGHPKIEYSVKAIVNFSQNDIDDYRNEINVCEKKICLFLLEPISKDWGFDQSEKPILGYTEYSILSYFFKNYPLQNKKVIIKPHPRQNIHDILQFLSEYIDKFDYDYDINTEQSLEFLISISDEVVGMTTVALIIALKAGKEIKSIQVGRNKKGKQISNEYFEKYLII